ncbi:MAG: phosphoribosylamine--glycine ligase N-terminal domain-containing protein, partial [Chloroflexota bacterium]
MRILVVGGGGREHALVWKIAQSAEAAEIYAAPGNAGTAALARNLNISATDIRALGEAARDSRIDLAVIGPEQTLSLGVVDHFASLGIPAFGPTQAAAQIETSKAFAKDLL